MKFKRFKQTVIILVISSLCFGLTVYIDFELKHRRLTKILSNTTETFEQNVIHVNTKVFENLATLKPPPQCDEHLFETLIYENKHLKNLGVIENDHIVCDIYQGSLYHKKIGDVSSFVDQHGHLYKFWTNKNYITIASSTGYFIEYDMDHYLDYFIADEISGFAIYGSQSKQIWFERIRHPLTSDETDTVTRLMLEAFEQFHSNPEMKALSFHHNNVLIKLISMEDGSILASYIHKDYADSFDIINTSHILAGLLLGFLVSYFIFRIQIRRNTLLSMLKEAVKNEEIFMVYQPLVDLKSNEKIIGFEALVRWQLSNGDYIRPDIFIPVAEKANFTKKLTNCIIDKIFEDLHDTLSTDPELYVSINITPSDLADDFLVKHIQAKLKQYHIQASQVVIELTERIVTDDHAMSGLQAIREAGMAISIDDFGTGSSNINYLAKLHPDVIKVDRSFVVWSETEGPTSTLLEKLISIGKDFKVKVVVEGVETQSQAQKCQELGADIGQGYYWFKPVAIKELLDYLT